MSLHGVGTTATPEVTSVVPYGETPNDPTTVQMRLFTGKPWGGDAGSHDGRNAALSASSACQRAASGSLGRCEGEMDKTVHPWQMIDFLWNPAENQFGIPPSRKPRTA